MPDEEAMNWKNRGDECVKQEQYEDAIKCYQNSITIDPKYVAAWNNIGYSLVKLGRKDEARQIKEKINEINNREQNFNENDKRKIREEVSSESSEEDELASKNASPITKEPLIKQIQVQEGLQNISKSITQKSFGVLGSVGGAFGSIKEAVKAEGRRISYNNLLKNHKIHIKKLIISEFDLRDLKKMCVYYNIGSPSDIRTNRRGHPYRVRLTYDDWARFVLKSFELTTLREYARLNYKLPSKIIEIEKKYKKERIEKFPDYEQDDGALSYGSDTTENPLIQELVKVIDEYQPIKVFKNEELYHTNLYTYLCEKIPGEIGFEIQRGSSRPDILVGDIAIEIKGPTDNQGLSTIADKINRYSQHFEHIIVVLFEVQTLERFYEEWYEGIMRQYGELVTIIRK